MGMDAVFLALTVLFFVLCWMVLAFLGKEQK
jgi:hypothetical protein